MTPKGSGDGWPRSSTGLNPGGRSWKAVFRREDRTWFAGGLTNVALNALDRHLPEKAQQVALLTLDGEGRLGKWTYKEVRELSSRLAGLFRTCLLYTSPSPRD